MGFETRVCPVPFLPGCYNKAVPMGFETREYREPTIQSPNNKAVPMGFETLQKDAKGQVFAS